MPQSRLWRWIRWHYRWLRASLSWLIDALLGVRTTLFEPTGPLQAEQPALTQSMPTGWLMLYRTFHSLQVGPDDVLIDIGAGAGRAVLVASVFPFRRVIGVERMEPLHRQASENLARWRVRRRAPVDFVLADASEFPIGDDVTIVFMYNPFSGPTFRRVISNVLASLDRAPRRCRLVYVNPVEHEHLIATDRFRLVRKWRGLRPSEDWARSLATYVYEIGTRLGPPSGGPARFGWSA